MCFAANNILLMRDCNICHAPAILVPRGRAPFGADQKERGLWGRECAPASKMADRFSELPESDFGMKTNLATE